MKSYCIADIHGNLKAFEQCIERSNINPEEDRLICLGDTADGFPDVFECFELLMTFKNLVYIIGNHDQFTRQWFLTGAQPKIWTNQGGSSTLKSYNYKFNQKHLDFLNKALPYYIEDNKVFVHGGFNPMYDIDQQDRDNLMWDRELIKNAKLIDDVENGTKIANTRMYNMYIDNMNKYDNIYVGHTCTQLFNSDEPLKYYNVWDLDTGAGHGAKLTIMNIDTEEYWQSDSNLYPDYIPRT